MLETSGHTILVLSQAGKLVGRSLVDLLFESRVFLEVLHISTRRFLVTDHSVQLILDNHERVEKLLEHGLLTDDVECVALGLPDVATEIPSDRVKHQTRVLSNSEARDFQYAIDGGLLAGVRRGLSKRTTGF